MLFPFLAPEIAVATPATVLADPPPADVQEIGPGQYSADTKTFQLTELDVSAGAISRRHGVALTSGDLARPQSAPATRPELAVFGPGWQAEFEGGQINRKLENQNGTFVATELEEGTSTSYPLKSSVSTPDGGGINTYEATDGSKITETTKWDPVVSAMRTTTAETFKTDLGPLDEGDEPMTNPDGTPVSDADIQLTYTWSRQSGAPSADPWRVTSVGTTALGKTAITYDAQARVSTVKEPARGENPASVTTFTYATATTAGGTSFGDFAGRLKSATVTYGTESPQTEASYTYDQNGLLRAVTDPSVGDTQATYAYDSVGRLSSIESASNGAWQLSFPAGVAAPQVTATGTDMPVNGGPTEGGGPDDPDASGPPASDFPPDGVDPPQSYPKKCNTAKTWMWYTKKGCKAWAYHGGTWRYPDWKRTASGFKVMGIVYDHCTKPGPDRPTGFDFRPACDSHDYGYGLIHNKKMGYLYYLDPTHARKVDVDTRFYITLKDKVCGGYFILVRGACRKIAAVYYMAVLKFGNP
ncbi:phospholipase A2 [Nonomuraea guangzhouensis]|uniref:Phospholipase A2 n=1 Tax=Nonomuraea guangzhouensis TaxID=1291555 RepID=A0ABW4G882_9ACTN|nr:phospholipase A2 [Nonomuraea guangzhouensis]